MADLRFAIIGAGNIAGVHAQAIDEVDGAVLVAVSDAGSGRGRPLADRYGARYLADAAEACADEGVDAVIVATPSGRHADAVIAAAEHGKHALVEKPLDVTLARCDAMVRAADEHGTVLAGVFQNRFAPGVVRTREAVRAGRLGRLVLANGLVPWHRPAAYYREGAWRGTWQLDGGGALMNQGIHTVDLLLHLAGPVTRVSAHTDHRVHAIETEDTAAAALGFENGAFGALQATTASWPGAPARVELYGDEGSIVLEDGRITLWRLRDADAAEEGAMLRLEEPAGSGSADPMAIGVDRHRHQLEDFVRAVRERHEPAVPGTEARRAVELVLAVYASARDGSRASLPLPAAGA
ncbi:MAG TPA: Gfo/Idh/MocA family oxidoreductase [Trueperaceae bacterium]|nr:Gfo/Idh/MocA family oxidoreductase [Trueperaceae bacterium]